MEGWRVEGWRVEGRRDGEWRVMVVIGTCNITSLTLLHVRSVPHYTLH